MKYKIVLIDKMTGKEKVKLGTFRLTDALEYFTLVQDRFMQAGDALMLLDLETKKTVKSIC